MYLKFNTPDHQLLIGDAELIKEIRLANSDGKTFFSNFVNDYECVMSLRNIDKGYYILSIYKEDGSTVIKRIEV